MDERTTTAHGDGGHARQGRIPCPRRVDETQFDEDYIQHIACCDPQELFSSVAGWNWDLTLLERGGLRVEGTILPLGQILVARLSFNRALLHRLEAPAGCTSVVLFSGGRGVFVEGHPVTGGGVLILRSGTTLEFVSRAVSVVSAISVSEAEWCRKVPLTDCAGTVLRSGVELLRFSADSTLALVRAIDSLADVFTLDPDALPGQALRESLADRLLALLARIHGESCARAAERPKGARRRMGVERAREYILNHLSDPIRLADLCRHTHLQARSLEYGFREIVGLSPVSYVKVLRLGEARRRLSSAACCRLSISEVALDSGFCHLSQFAADYKKLFMESPSATRQRSVGQRTAGAKAVVQVRRTGAFAQSVLNAGARALTSETRTALLRFASSPAASPMSALGS
jgi:AraC family transcriptional regulator, ethanolamine operon transcriptional activator